jgi:hypothetical protein
MKILNLCLFLDCARDIREEIYIYFLECRQSIKTFFTWHWEKSVFYCPRAIEHFGLSQYPRKELEQNIIEEQKLKKEEQEKKKADDLWSSFMSDVGSRPKPSPSQSHLTSCQ